MNRFFEELSMNAWPSLRSQHYDGWILRYANGYTKRANSVYPIYESTLALEEKIQYCEQYYAELAVPATFKLHDGESHHLLDIYLEDQGYHVVDPTEVMTLDLDQSHRVNDQDYRVVHGYSEKVTEDIAACLEHEESKKGDKLLVSTMKSIMALISSPSFYVFIEEDGEVLAFGNGVVEHGYVGIYNMGVKAAYRGKGYGRRVVMALLSEGMKLGGEKSYLQVVSKNEIAMNLYAALGYQKAYRYWYRRKNDLFEVE